MPEGIGNIRPTLIPSLTEVADIQTAFRLYHYGSTSVPGSIASASNTSIVGIIRDLTIDDLKDVVITSAATGQTIVYNGTNWINALADGDISAVSSGTGIVITGGTGPIPSIAVDTTFVATTSNTMTLTNKTLVAPTLQNPSVTGSITISSQPVITSTSATSANIFTSTVTNITIGSSTIKTTQFPADGTVSTATASAGYMGMPRGNTGNAITGPYTISAADAGEHLYVTTTGQTITIPSNASVALPIGTTIIVVNGNGVSTSIAIDTDTLRLANSTSTGTRTLASNGMCTLLKITATEWIASGNGLT